MSARNRSQNNIHRFLLLIILPTFLLACASTPGKPGKQALSPASKLYADGKEALSASNYDEAIKQFVSLENLYPADPYAQQAQMELAYAYHKNGDASSAIATADLFIKNYPTHANVDYAYYLRGLTSFEQAIDQLSSESIQTTQRRPLMAQLSLQYLSELIDKFPDSKYSNDASRRITFLNEKLAQYEVLLAKSFLDKGDYASAALHAKSAMENYPQAPAMPEAASIINEAYKMLNITAPNTAATDSSNISTGSNNITPAPAKKPSVIIPFKPKVPQEKSKQADAAKPAVTAKEATTSAPVTEVTQEEPPVSIPPQADVPVAQPDNEIKQESWILAQVPDNYTIQLMGTGNPKLLVAIIQRLNIADKAAYYKNTQHEKPWYALTYGTFSSIAEANNAINQLPAELLKGQPWIRKFGDIQLLIKSQ